MQPEHWTEGKCEWLVDHRVQYPAVRGGQCRIRTRVDGFEARQDIQATLIALSGPKAYPF